MESEGWIRCRLGDAINLKRGYDLPARKRRKGSVPIVSSSGQSGFHDESKVSGPGVVTGRYGTVGQVFFIDQDYWPLNTALYVQDFKGNKPQFVAALLRTINWHAHDGKSGVPGINRNDVHSDLVSLPPVPEQYAIASVLGALDDKVARNRCVASRLSDLGLVYFSHLFGTRIEGPTPLTEVTEVVGGKSYKSSELAPSSTALVSLKSIASSGGYQRGGLKAFTGSFKEKQVVHAGEIVVALTDLTQAANVVGRAARVPDQSQFETLVASLDLAVLRPRPPISHSFLYGLLNSRAWQQQAYGYANGSTVLHLSKDAFPEFLIDVPVAAEMDRLDALCNPLYAAAGAMEAEAETLTAIRDALLPKLVSGEIRVPLYGDTDEQIGAAVEALNQ